MVIRRSEESEESETETIYSEQGYETIKAEEENDEAASSGSDMDTTREVFEVEYDIDSGEEEERPPQVDKCWITDNRMPLIGSPRNGSLLLGLPLGVSPISQLNSSHCWVLHTELGLNWVLFHN